ncbi:MAG: helix-turn-helix domain-containing protein [Nanoarchaeota archaeon]
MKNAELIYREILYQAIEKKNRVLTQAELARKLRISLSIVNGAIKSIERLGAVEVRPRNFHILDIKKILYYWASIRNISKDIIYSTRIEKPVVEIEKLMPDTVIFGAYSAYKYLFKDVPADYSEVYVYGNKELEERFPKSKGIPNLFVLKKDDKMESYGKTTTIANTFVDLWNLREWYAKDFLKALEERLYGVLE